jgi:predicted nucleotidyltransferase
MDFETLILPLIHRIRGVDAIEGAYLSGSLVNEDRDEYSDIDLGIASRST